MTKLIIDGLGTEDSQPTIIKIPIVEKSQPEEETNSIIPIVYPETSETKETVTIEITSAEPLEETPVEISITKQEPELKKNDDSVMDTISTGFGHDNAVYASCPVPEYHQHLCKELFLGEFKTEEEKQLARHNLGLYDERDIVALSLITTEEEIKTPSILDDLEIKIIKQGNKAFATETVADAVMVKRKNEYISLQSLLDDEDGLVSSVNEKIDKLLAKSASGSNITTIGDINYFLKGYKNNETLQNILGDYLKFESKGTISQKAWQV